MRRGNFVWCNFPYDSETLAPGPEPHIVYVFDTKRSGDGTTFVECVYTTSQPWRESDKPPFWIIPIDKEEARSLGQIPFRIDASRITRIPMTAAWFPKLNDHDQGVLKVRASDTLQDRILDALAAVAKRRPDLRIARVRVAPLQKQKAKSKVPTRKEPGK